MYLRMLSQLPLLVDSTHIMSNTDCFQQMLHLIQSCSPSSAAAAQLIRLLFPTSALQRCWWYSHAVPSEVGNVDVPLGQIQEYCCGHHESKDESDNHPSRGTSTVEA
mmetsp:Transcript_6328/g.10564  ORF Transcript_6328/g.10564 Transcript_6328/m.10564 type:complete len:107 (-) Transcript_6328:310-630(-)